MKGDNEPEEAEYCCHPHMCKLEHIQHTILEGHLHTNNHALHTTCGTPLFHPNTPSQNVCRSRLETYLSNINEDKGMQCNRRLTAVIAVVIDFKPAVQAWTSGRVEKSLLFSLSVTSAYSHFIQNPTIRYAYTVDSSGNSLYCCVL